MSGNQTRSCALDILTITPMKPWQQFYLVNKKQEALLTLRGQHGHCRNIKEKPQIYGSFPNPRPRPLFIWVWFCGGIGKPKLCTKFEVASRSRCRNIIEKPRNIVRSSRSPRPPTFSSGCDFMMGSGKPKLSTKFEVASFSHCRNIKGEAQISGSSPSPGPCPPFLQQVILWWHLTNPSCLPNLKFLAPAVAEILQGNHKIMGAPVAQVQTHFLLCMRFYDGPWQTQAVYQIW